MERTPVRKDLARSQVLFSIDEDKVRDKDSSDEDKARDKDSCDEDKDSREDC